MSAIRLIGITLLVAGIFAVILGGFSCTVVKEKADIGPIELAVKEKHRVNIPLWAGIGAIVVGGVLLAVKTKE